MAGESNATTASRPRRHQLDLGGELVEGDLHDTVVGLPGESQLDLRLVVLLSEPARDFSGGELVIAPAEHGDSP
ncbi:MAG: hypothetical protein ACTHU0_05100 [Kofleriaceae bacterium]